MAKKPQTLVSGLWRTDGDFIAKIHIQNALSVSGLDVTPILYFEDGTALRLQPVTIPASGAATVNINQALRGAPAQFRGHISDFGSAALTYAWDGPGHVSASLNVKDIVHSLSFSQPFRPGGDSMATMAMTPGMGDTMAGVRQIANRARLVLATYRQASGMPSSGAMTWEGVWWRHDPGVNGFIALANTSAAPLAARYQVTGRLGTALSWHRVLLSPHGMVRVSLAPEIRALPPGEQEGGGVRVEDAGVPASFDAPAQPADGSLFASGWLVNREEGFSANIDFAMTDMAGAAMSASATGPQIPNSTEITVAASGLMLGRPMAANHFPDGTNFTPYGYLRNTTSRPMPVQLQATLAMGGMDMSGSPSSLNEPLHLQLAPDETRRIDLAALSRRLGEDDSEGQMLNWSAAFTGQTGDLVMTTGSTDQTGTYVFQVIPQRVGPSAGQQLPFWSTAGGSDTMISLWNPTATTQNVILMLRTSDGKHSYSVPVSLPPQASSMVDIAMLRAEGMPDPDGNLLPPDADRGSAMLMPAGIPKPGPDGRIKVPNTGFWHMEVVMSEGVFNVATATCCVDCSQCCGYNNGQIVGDSSFGISGRGDYGMTVEDCSGQLLDCTADAGWFSSNTAVTSYAGLVNGNASFTGAGVGNADVTGDDFMNIPIGKGEDCTCGCPQGDVEGMMPIQVQPVITSISPAQGLIGSSAQVEIDGMGFTGSSVAVTVTGSGGSTSGTQPVSDSEIDFTLGLTTSPSPTTIQISVTVDGIPSSNSEIFTRQSPHLAVFADHELDVTSGCGTKYTLRNITYNIADQSGNAINTPIQEAFNSISANSCGNGAPTPTSCTQSPLSQFTDHLSVGCNGVGGACGFNLVNQWRSCPVAGTSVPLGTTTWQIENNSTTLTIGSNSYTLTFGDTGTRVPPGTLINP